MYSKFNIGDLVNLDDQHFVIDFIYEYKGEYFYRMTSTCGEIKVTISEKELLECQK